MMDKAWLRQRRDSLRVWLLTQRVLWLVWRRAALASFFSSIFEALPLAIFALMVLAFIVPPQWLIFLSPVERINDLRAPFLLGLAASGFSIFGLSFVSYILARKRDAERRKVQPNWDARNELRVRSSGVYVVAEHLQTVARITLFCIGVYGLAFMAKGHYSWVAQRIPAGPLGELVMFTGTLTLGVLLFGFRLKARFFYGLTEAVVGAMVATTKMPSEGVDLASWHSETYLTILTAGVYLVVRGLDNMHTGLKAESKDILLRWWARD